MKKISSKDNPTIKLVRNLKKKKHRDEEKLFVVEGKKELMLAIKNGFKVKFLIFCPEVQDQEFDSSFTNIKEILSVPLNIFTSISYRENSDAYLGVFESKKIALNDLHLSPTPFLLVLQNIEKPGNIGAILRTADACGVDAVILNDQSTDIFNPNVVRSSLGALFSVPLVQADKFETFDYLAKNKIKTIATSPSARQNYTKIDLGGSVAVLIGEEHRGLDDFWLDKADVKVKIPMRGQIDSLNASVSAAVLAYEILRQRQDQSTLT